MGKHRQKRSWGVDTGKPHRAVFLIHVLLQIRNPLILQRLLMSRHNLLIPHFRKVKQNLMVIKGRKCVRKTSCYQFDNKIMLKNRKEPDLGPIVPDPADPEHWHKREKQLLRGGIIFDKYTDLWQDENYKKYRYFKLYILVYLGSSSAQYIRPPDIGARKLATAWRKAS
jgi:hypothetical protein